MIHAPEGSWVTWPWAYDAAMAMLATLAMQLHASDPMTALAWVAPCWGLVNTALVIGITRRLRFPLLFQVVALACFATSPLTQLLHRVGMLDHHFVEYSFVLAILYLGLGWAQHPCRVRWATALGLALGAAPAFHNGLFILQLPVIAVLVGAWLSKTPALEERMVFAFGSVLLASTAAFLLLSSAFQSGLFDYTLHSWFHVYIAATTTLIAAYCVRVSSTLKVFEILAAIGVLALLPIVQQIEAGEAFVTGAIPGLARMGEVIGPWEWFANGR